MRYYILFPLFFLTGCAGGIELKKLGSDDQCIAVGACQADAWFGDLNDSHELNVINLSDTTARLLLLKYFPAEAPAYASDPYDFKMRMAWAVPQNATDFTVTDVLFEMRFVFVGRTFVLNPNNFAIENLSTIPANNMYSFRYQNDVSGVLDNRLIIGGRYNSADLMMAQSSFSFTMTGQGTFILGGFQNSVCDLLLEPTDFFPQCFSL